MLYAFLPAVLIMFLVSIAWAVDFSLRPYVLKTIIDRISGVPHQDVFQSIAIPALLYFCMILINQILLKMYDYFISIRMIPYLRHNIARMSFNRLLYQDYSFHKNNFAGSLSNKVNDLVSSIPDIIYIFFDSFFSYILALIIAFFTLWQVSFVFAIGMIAWSIIFIAISLLLSEKLASLADAWSECSSIVTGRIVDSLSNILFVRLFSGYGTESNLLSRIFGKSIEAEQKLQWTYFWISLYYNLSFVLVQVVSFYFLLKGYQENTVTAGDFVVVLSINFAIVDSLWSLAKDFFQFSKLWGRATQALNTIAIEPEIKDAEGANPLQVTRGRIVFDNVQFKYKDAASLFQNKSVVIEPYQKVGLVGHSGCGKTTFINLILRLYDVSSGRILIDDQDIHNVTLQSLHDAIAVIPQDPLLFNRTLMENIRYARITATDDEVMQAARQAHAHTFIQNMPQGYNTLAQERGSRLSGGQRQRIAIARAILKNAPILILDEATSQLDSVTENLIQDSLNELMEGKTTIVIAHRLSTLLTMDRILVFDQGKIVEDGTHQELLERGGIYKTLWKAQVGGFLPE
jgi:ATP-binding cassette subfamily B protein